MDDKGLKIILVLRLREVEEVINALNDQCPGENKRCYFQELIAKIELQRDRNLQKIAPYFKKGDE